MKKLSIITLLFLSLSSFVVMNVYKSSGGHPSSTGAPGEASCADATTGCHANAVVKKDTSNTVNTLQFSAADSSYKPGQTYTITISAFKSGITRFGFEIVALTSAGNSNTGTWVITDGNRTHTLVGSGALASRKYVTHSLMGTPEVSSGLGQWSFKWTAPATNVGNITFYYATNCTNNNSNASGDQLFLSSFEIHPDPSAATSANAIDRSDYNVSYNGTARQLTVNYTLSTTSKTTVQVFDMQGKLVQGFAPSEKKSGKISESFTLSSAVRNGMYLVHLSAGDQTVTEKLLVE